MSIRIRPSWKASWWQENIEYNTPSRKIGNFSQHFPIIWLGNLITLWEFGSHVLENMAWPFIRVLDLKCHLWICFWHYSWKLMRLSIGVYLNVDHHNDLAILVVPNQIVVSYIGWPHCWVTLNNLIPCGSYDRPFLWLEGHNCSFMFESSSSFALFQNQNFHPRNLTLLNHIDLKAWKGHLLHIQDTKCEQLRLLVLALRRIGWKCVWDLFLNL